MAGFKERLVHDAAKGELRDGKIRYVMMRADALMGLFRLMPEEAGRLALAALGWSVLSHGGKSALAYLEQTGSSDARPLCGIIAETAPHLGWGVWQFGPDRENELTLDVENSPFAAGHGPANHPVCSAVTGMLQAVSGLVLGGECEAREVSCCAQTGGTRCQFTARRVS